MRAEWFAGLTHAKLLNFGEKFRRHSRRGKKAEIAAARFTRFILGCFRGELRQRLAAGNAHRKRLDRFCLRLDIFRGRFGMGGEKDLRYTKARRLLEKITVHLIKTPAFLFGNGWLRGDLFLQPLEGPKLAGDFFPQPGKRETTRAKSVAESGIITKFSAVKREFVIELRGIDSLLGRNAIEIFCDNEIGCCRRFVDFEIVLIKTSPVCDGDEMTAAGDNTQRVAKTRRAAKQLAADDAENARDRDRRKALHFSAISER